ncbi:MAG: B12-binding domain-containing radical SAM protein [Magnetospirillum sp. WYHS-4]
MKVLFLTAPYDLMREGYGSKSSVKYGNLPPLGVLYMIGQLRREGHDGNLIDLSTFSMSYDEVVERIRQYGPDVIGISTMTPSAPHSYDLVRYLRKRFELPIVMGGVHCNSFKEQVLEDVPELDAICIGEGEFTILDMVKAFEGKMPMNEVKGMAYRDAERRIVRNEGRPLIQDLDTIAFPARDVLDHGAYRLLPLSFKRSPVTSMITSRGCPYGNCSFCFEAGNAAFKYRRHSPEYVIREIQETIIPNGIREVAFWDDIFLINHRWVREFCEGVRGMDLTWSAYGWPRRTTKDILDMAAKAGCWSVFYGFESGDQTLLDGLNKRISLDDSRRAAKWTHEAGMATRGSFMLALPGETPELARKTVDFAIELDCTLAQFLPTFPEKGTELYEMALKEGKVVEYRGHMKAHYIPHGYESPEEVEKMLRYAHLRFYMRPRLWWTHLKRIRSLEDLEHYFNAFRMFVGMFRRRTADEPRRTAVHGMRGA